MVFRLEPDEAVGVGLKRLLTEQIEAATNDLADGDPDRGVHNARRRCKRIRAALWLIRPRLPDEFKTENRWFRDTAQKLAQVRDATAMVESFDLLAGASKVRDIPAEFASVRKGLEERHSAVAKDRTDDGDQLRREVITGLQEARARIDAWAFSAEGLAIIKPGFKQLYRRSRRSLKRAAKSRAAEDLHEWRKFVKYYWHATEVLRRHIELFKKEYRAELHQLSDLLGDDHDLAVLREKVITKPKHYGNSEKVLEFVQVIDERRAELQRDAIKIGKKIFAEKPGRFVRSLLP